jgi:hypothetical protein
MVFDYIHHTFQNYGNGQKNNPFAFFKYLFLVISSSEIVIKVQCEKFHHVLHPFAML